MTGSMKQMQCNMTPSLNIKTTTKKVWLYFIRRTTRPGYAGTTTNLQIPYLNQATQKNTCQIFLPKKIPESKFSNLPKTLRSSLTLEIWITSPGGTPTWLQCYSHLNVGIGCKPPIKQVSLTAVHNPAVVDVLGKVKAHTSTGRPHSRI